jgi:methyl-accepting chemotaxis protein
MRSGKIITLSVWLMILFNLLLSFGGVWSFQRMTPEIQSIYERNIVSVDACEQMLLALTGEQVNTKDFQEALNTAANNITEKGEEKTVREIQTLFNALPQDPMLKKDLSEKIVELNNFNKQAIIASAQKAQRLRQAGAWGIVMMTITFFIAAIFFEQKLRRALLAPLQEIASVLDAHKQGDRYRRCQLPNASSDMKKVLQEINNLLDR